MSNPKLEKIIKLTQAQYDILSNGGTVGDYTGLNDNYLYLIQENYDFPTTSTARKILMSTSTAGLLQFDNLTSNDIPSLDASKITSGTFADSRIASAATWNAKYTKPSGGIPASDLAESYSLSTHAHDTRYVRFDAAQSLTNDQKAQARTNIGAGTSSFSGSYNDLTNKPSVVLYTSQTLTDAQKTQARTNIGAGTSSFSGSYNDLSNKPTIPSVSNATITIKQTGINDQTFTLNGSATTITLADTNTWRGIQDNLTSTSTSDSLSANQGRLLANGSARDSTKLPLAGGTMTDTLTIDTTSVNKFILKGASSAQSYIQIFNNDNSHSAYLGVNSSSQLITYGEASSWRILATRNWVEGKGYTTNAGTVTSVGAGTGLSISGTASVNPTVNIASGYKLPTTTEWNSKANASALSNYLPLSGGTITGSLELSDGNSYAVMSFYDYGNVQGVLFNVADNTNIILESPADGDEHVIALLDDIPTNVSAFANDAGYITSYTNSYHTPVWPSQASISKVKIATGNNGAVDMYLPVASTTNYGLAKAANVRSTAPTVTTGGTTSNRYYGVELDKNGKMFVNVPWSSGSGTTTHLYVHEVYLSLDMGEEIKFVYYSTSNNTTTMDFVKDAIWDSIFSCVNYDMGSDSTWICIKSVSVSGNTYTAYFTHWTAYGSYNSYTGITIDSENIVEM